MERYLLAIAVEKDDDGYFAYCPQLQGCYTQGDTYEEAQANIKEAVSLVIEDMVACGEHVPSADNVSLTTLHVAF
ncbi:MAG: type II toxin-antitoxin system HicB family antitoxin [Chloroflexi bacterium]|nr:type II toxin-antitoxin system HicB family antitoxin [Chloroflexota bacterium]